MSRVDSYKPLPSGDFCRAVVACNPYEGFTMQKALLIVSSAFFRFSAPAIKAQGALFFCDNGVFALKCGAYDDKGGE